MPLPAGVAKLARNVAVSRKRQKTSREPGRNLSPVELVFG